MFIRTVHPNTEMVDLVGVEPTSLKQTSTNTTCLVHSNKTFTQNEQGGEDLSTVYYADTVDPGA